MATPPGIPTVSVSTGTSSGLVTYPPATPVRVSGSGKKSADSRKRVAYAEGTLDVHGAYERCQSHMAVLASRIEVVLETTRKRRDIDFRIEERETELVSRERGVPEIAKLSVAAFDRHMKGVFANDRELYELRSSRLKIQSEHERAEYEAEIARIGARMETARMEELDGLLHFYAVADPTANETE